jgi:hypothetical protein
MTAPTLPPEVRSPTTTRTNRIALLVVGLILLAGGTAALLAGLGAFGARRADQPVFSDGLVRFADRNAAWFWPVVAMVAVIVGLLALWWLLLQARRNRVGDLDLERDHSHGRTRLGAAAFTDAVADEIESYRGVAGASARLLGTSADPRLSLRVYLDGRVDLGEVLRRIEAEALAHARAALSADQLPTRIELVVPRHPASRPAVAAPER